MQPQEWSISALATELGIDRRTLSKRLSEVPPVRTKGKTKYWRLKDALPAIDNSQPEKSESSNESESAARARLTRARADIHEATASQMSGDLIPVEHITAAWSQIVARIRGSLIALPDRAAPLVEHTNDIEEIRELIRSVVYEALDELASVEIEVAPHDSSSNGSVDQPTPGDRGKRRSGGRRPNGSATFESPSETNFESVGG